MTGSYKENVGDYWNFGRNSRRISRKDRHRTQDHGGCGQKPSRGRHHKSEAGQQIKKRGRDRHQNKIFLKKKFSRIPMGKTYLRRDSCIQRRMRERRGELQRGLLRGARCPPGRREFCLLPGHEVSASYEEKEKPKGTNSQPRGGGGTWGGGGGGVGGELFWV